MEITVEITLAAMIVIISPTAKIVVDIPKQFLILGMFITHCTVLPVLLLIIGVSATAGISIPSQKEMSPEESSFSRFG